MHDDNKLYEGSVARVLKTIWYSNGKISAEAFALRPRLHEDYISVLRENHVDFMADLCAVCKKDIDCSYASLFVEQVEKLNVPELLPNEVKFLVSGVDNIKMKSHAGIFVTVNGEKLVGGQPLASLVNRGLAQKTAVMMIQLKLSKLAEMNVKRMLLSSSLDGAMVSEPSVWERQK